MGLDAVELVMEVEETFGIKIDDRDAEKIITVGGLFEYVLRQLEAAKPQSGKCGTAVAFYRLRRTLGESLGVARPLVKPSTALDDLVPADGRRSSWPRLERALELRLPRLLYPEWVVATLLLLGVLTFLTTSFMAVLLISPWSIGGPIALCAVIAVWLTSLAASAARPLAVRLPAECQSVADLTRAIASANYGRIAAAQGCWNRAEVWDVLRKLIGEQLGVEPEELKAESRFVDDLGID